MGSSSATKTRREAVVAEPVEQRRPRRVRTLTRHVLALVVAAVAFAVFWATRPTWVPEMRLWKAVGDVSLVLLLATVAIGPLGRFVPRVARALPWRRELGIWFAVFASLHTFLILNGWARWSVQRFFGYELVPQLGRVARLEPGFGLANLLGLVALGWTLALAATSSDLAMRKLGPSAWKWLHNATYVVFWTVLVHVSYFLFLHFTASFHKQVPPPDWFRYPFLVAALSVVGLQVAAFVRTVRSRSRSRSVDTSSAAGRGRAATAGSARR